MTTEKKNLNPGSVDAIDHGCTCPVLSNNYGLSPPIWPGSWWIDVDCPLHGDTKAEGESNPVDVST